MFIYDMKMKLIKGDIATGDNPRGNSSGNI